MKKKSEMSLMSLERLGSNIENEYAKNNVFTPYLCTLIDGYLQIKNRYETQLHEESGSLTPFELVRERVFYKANTDIGILKTKLRNLRNDLAKTPCGSADWIIMQYNINGMQNKLNLRLATNEEPRTKFGAITYTNHVLVRYIERKYKVDVDTIRNKIIADLVPTDDEKIDYLVLKELHETMGIDPKCVRNALKMELDAQFYYNGAKRLNGKKYTYIFLDNKLVTMYSNPNI
jgi:hypothetical protein